MDARSLYEAMVGNAGPEATGWTGPLDPPAPSGRRSVVVLGAGIAGLTAAYELGRAGFDCTVLEAQGRLGGRVRTARRGDELREVDASGQVVRTHTCAFDDGLYVDLGPARIPHHHRRVLAYCRDFGVRLEPHVMESPAGLVRLSRSTRARWRNRQIANDARGHLAALMTSKLSGHDAFTGELRDLLRVFGALDDAGEYRGSTRSGYGDADGGGTLKPRPPIGLGDLVASGFWRTRFDQPRDYLWQATMFQPAGGMDMLVGGFADAIGARLGDVVSLGAEVTAVTLPDGGGVRVEYVRDGAAFSVEADHCVSTVPLPVLREVALNGFAPEFERAVRAVGFASTCKVGWQADERFWEDGPEPVYGGVSLTDHLIGQLWYPSHGFFSGNGTLVGACNFGRDADAFGAMPPRRRLEEARRGAAELHPEFGRDGVVPFDRGITIAWHKVPHQLGGWAAWNPADPAHGPAYRTLLRPEGGGRFLVAGDQASPLPGWMEGAMMSAHFAVLRLLGLVPLTVPGTVAVPDSAALTQGFV